MPTSIIWNLTLTYIKTGLDLILINVNICILTFNDFLSKLYRFEKDQFILILL